VVKTEPELQKAQLNCLTVGDTKWAITAFMRDIEGRKHMLLNTTHSKYHLKCYRKQ